jgi:NADP-dependent 3-hydroxy acid dehydrogenase YdfG
MARVLITGASTGIGRATALELAKRGHEVVATARRPQTLEDLPVAARLALDVTDQASVDAAIAAAGPLDALISNAGATLRGTVEATPLSEYQRMLDLNFLGALRVTKAVLPGFRTRGGGRIVLVSSILGRLAIPLISGYAASKFALEAVAEALAQETRHLGITVTTVQPGAVLTDGAASATVWPDDDDAYAPLWAAAGGARTGAITADEVAAVIADVLEDPAPPLRVPAGPMAERLLSALHAAPATEPFSVAGPLTAAGARPSAVSPPGR